MRELNVSEVNEINGGWLQFLGAAAAYMAIIDYSMDFGRGLGAGFYEATHIPTGHN